jgi:hypothetical protein
VDNQTARQNYQEASSLFAQGRFGEALELLNRLAELFPDDEQIQQARSKCEAAVQQQAASERQKVKKQGKGKSLLILVGVCLLVVVGAMLLRLLPREAPEEAKPATALSQGLPPQPSGTPVKQKSGGRPGRTAPPRTPPPTANFTQPRAAEPAFNQIAPNVFRATKPTVSTKLRVYGTLADYFNFEFMDEDTRCWSIRITNYEGHTVYGHGYIFKSSLGGKTLFSVLKDGKSHKLVLSVSCLPNARDASVFVIDQVHSVDSWDDEPAAKENLSLQQQVSALLEGKLAWDYEKLKALGTIVESQTEDALAMLNSIKSDSSRTEMSHQELAFLKEMKSSLEQYQSVISGLQEKLFIELKQSAETPLDEEHLKSFILDEIEARMKEIQELARAKGAQGDE